MSEKVKEKGRKGAIALERFENLILLIRDERVILDNDLARLYGVETRRLNEQVRRNAGRFPHDFMFQVSPEEFEDLKSHFATSRSGWGGRRKLPLVFTENGAITVHTLKASGMFLAHAGMNRSSHQQGLAG